KANIIKFSHESPEEVSLRQELKDMDIRIKGMTAAAQTPAPSGGGGSVASAPQDDNGPLSPLPQEIMNLMEQRAGNMDPALKAQFLFAVGKYSELRSQIATAHLKLDAAQAAFNHRYQVVAPPEVPNKPAKPKVPVLFAAGFVLSLLLALIVPVVA